MPFTPKEQGQVDILLKAMREDRFVLTEMAVCGMGRFVALCTSEVPRLEAMKKDSNDPLNLFPIALLIPQENRKLLEPTSETISWVVPPPAPESFTPN